MSEPSESRPVEIDGEGVVRSDEDVDPHIELFVSDEKRIMDVALYDVRFWLVGRVGPIADVVE